MYICVCNAVTESQIRHAVSTGKCSSMKQLCQDYRVATQCGKCCQDAKKIFKECKQSLS